jgi:hypothetical protein
MKFFNFFKKQKILILKNKTKTYLVFYLIFNLATIVFLCISILKVWWRHGHCHPKTQLMTTFIHVTTFAFTFFFLKKKKTKAS